MDWFRGDLGEYVHKRALFDTVADAACCTITKHTVFEHGSMYECILVPTDGSEHADAAADRALDLAELLGATVHAVSVIESGPLGSVDLPGDSASATEVLTERATEFVESIVERGDERGVTVTSELRDGVPVEEIRDCAMDVDADIVVMGTRGRGGVSRMILGSVTDGVARASDIDVLVVGADEES